MSKKKFLTIQIIPGSAGKIRSYKLSYTAAKVVIYLALILFVAFIVFAVNFTTINMKAFVAEDLAQQNAKLLKNQKKIDSLEDELLSIYKKSKIIRIQFYCCNSFS